eukprot:TRINITY_DN5427_c0_g4_i2.p1 TRINITY_DN5427_c0_g4~~TRINITY_DN5427_c0_g4_i2.p1  ORF type:complete len:270 (-),score=30.80 TRINITY_DN5427_c0_g4_i2:386-1081(-)
MRTALQKSMNTSGLCIVHGAGGMGKTVATCASLRSDESLSELFPGGVAYVTIGQAPDILTLQAQILRAFGSHEPPADSADGYARILQVLGGRESLVVLDDVWEVGHLECFAPLRARPKAWSNVVMMCTTRFVDLVPARAKAELVKLGDLTDAEASQLLGIERNSTNNPVLAKLAKILCSRSPLALSILGAAGRLEVESGKTTNCWPGFHDELCAHEKSESNAVKLLRVSRS